MLRRSIAGRLAIVVFGSMALWLASEPIAADEQPADKRQIFVEFCVFEVDIAKLKAFGFDWGPLVKIFLSPAKEIDETDEPVEPLAFMRAMASNNLVRVQSNPRLATMSGRAASLEVGEALKLNLTPQATGGDVIKLDYRLQLSEPRLFDEQGRSYEARGIPPGKSTWQSAATVELKAGRTHFSSLPPFIRTDGRGKRREVTTVVLIRADFEPPKDVRTAEKQPPRKPSYREVPGR